MMRNDHLGYGDDRDHRVCDRPGSRISEDLPGSIDKKNLKKIILGVSLGYGFACVMIIQLDLQTRYRFAPVLMDPNDLVSFIYLVTLGMASLFIILFEIRRE